jgi:CPA2 family monovalent cation:H+ antiporter-2
VRSDLYILADTREVNDIDDLYQRGADIVIAQDFETSIEMAAHVLKKMNIPAHVIRSQLAALREGGYRMFRSSSADKAPVSDRSS